ncbi:MAG: hypothetical protein AAGE94_08415 [Acidobacteriota bacterium]
MTTRLHLLLIVIGLAFVAGGLSTPADAVAITAEPRVPHAAEPFRLAFGGYSVDQFDHEQPEVEIDGTTIRVIRNSSLPGFPVPDDPWAFFVDVDPLPPGDYTVELWFRVTALPSPFSSTLPSTAPNKSDDLVLQASSTVFIEPPMTFDVRSIDPLFPAGYFLSGPRPMRFFGQVFAPSAGLEPPIVDHEARRIDLSVHRSQLLAPPPRDIEVEEVATLDLAAGTWTVTMSENDVVRVRRTIEVLPFPVTLHDGRFEVTVDWLNQDVLSAAPPVGPPSEDSALFWFFEATNWELMLKVLDGCALNGHYWVFGAAQTDLGYQIQIRDTLTDTIWTAENLAGTPSPAITDTTAFATCP